MKGSRKFIIIRIIRIKHRLLTLFSIKNLHRLYIELVRSLKKKIIIMKEEIVSIHIKLIKLEGL